MENKKIKLFELFAGIGAPRKALEYMGYEVESLGFSEINNNAIKTYCELFNDIPDNNFGDITKIEKLPDDIDILFHGSPCQDFSVAGKRLGGDENSRTRSSLLYESVRLIEQTQPKMVIWENVKAVLNAKNIKNVKNCLIYEQSVNFSKGYKKLCQDFSPCLSCRECDLIKLRFDDGELKKVIKGDLVWKK